jgi:succinoglycan biosynthesis transport protein ExoP
LLKLVKTHTQGALFQDILRIIFSRKKIILISFLGMIGLALIVALNRPPKYEAVTKIIAKERRTENLHQGHFYTGYRTDRMAFLQSQVELLLSDEMTRRVLAKLFPSEKEVAPEQVKSFQKNIKISSPKGYDFSSSDMLFIRVADRVPSRAAEKANLLINEYIKYAHEIKGKAAEQTLELLEKQAQAQMERVRQAEELMNNFEKKSGPDLAFFIATVKTKGANSELITSNNNYLAARVALKETESYLNQLRIMVQKGAVPQKLVRENPVLAAIKENIIKLENQLAAFNAQQPEISKNIMIMKEIERNKQIFNRELKSDIEGRFVDTITLEARVKTLKEMVDHYTAMAQRQLEYLKLYRDYEQSEEGYQDLLRNIQKVRLTEIDKLTDLEIIDAAKIPTGPAGSFMIKDMLMGGIIGLLLGLGLAFVLDFFDPTLKSVKEVERYLNMPVLGSIPRR